MGEHLVSTSHVPWAFPLKKRCGKTMDAEWVQSGESNMKII